MKQQLVVEALDLEYFMREALEQARSAGQRGHSDWSSSGDGWAHYRSRVQHQPNSREPASAR